MTEQPQSAPKIKKQFHFYTWIPKQAKFTSQTELMNYLLTNNLVKVDVREIKCRYCGVDLTPSTEGAHYFSKHSDKVSLK